MSVRGGRVVEQDGGVAAAGYPDLQDSDTVARPSSPVAAGAADSEGADANRAARGHAAPPVHGVRPKAPHTHAAGVTARTVRAETWGTGHGTRAEWGRSRRALSWIRGGGGETRD